MIVAICGRIASGKSTLSQKIIDGLCSKHSVRRISFAHQVKRYAGELFGCDVDGPNKNRAILQTFAESMKAIDPDIWVKMTRQLIDSTPADFVIIDDLRFPNELRMLRALGALIIRINITKDVQMNRIQSTYGNYDEHISRLDHVSESHVDTLDVDMIVPTDYDFEAIMERIWAHKLDGSRGNRD